MQAMKTRRSIRAYKEGMGVEQSVLEELLQAAQQAPSWKNSQTGRYYVVTSPKLLATIKEQCLPPFNAKNCAHAPALIIAAYETGISGFGEAGPVNELGDGWGAYDLGMQNQNLLLRARELGLGTLVMGIRDGKKLRKLLSIPETQAVAAVISVGYPDIDPEMRPRKDLSEVARFF